MGFEIKDIVELYGRWLDGELKAIAPYLPTPPSIEELIETFNTKEI